MQFSNARNFLRMSITLEANGSDTCTNSARRKIIFDTFLFTGSLRAVVHENNDKVWFVALQYSIGLQDLSLFKGIVLVLDWGDLAISAMTNSDRIETNFCLVWLCLWHPEWNGHIFLDIYQFYEAKHFLWSDLSCQSSKMLKNIIKTYLAENR